MKNNKEIIPIFFATDDNYIPFLAVALQSIKANASKEYLYNIHILHMGLSQESMNIVNNFIDENFNIFYNDVQDSLNSLASQLFVRDYYSKATYYRIFIPSIFPQYDKALYLDCDITVTGDISTLYNTELGENYVGAITDEAVSKTPEFIAYVENFLGISQPDYFNAGILVINLKQLRAVNFDKKFMDLLEKYKFVVAQDQDYLNVLCKDKVTRISKVWNKQPIPDPDLPESDIKLIHYNLSFKPWHYNNIEYENHFWKYANETSVIDKITEIKNNFSIEKQEKDQAGGRNLIQLADTLSRDPNTFKQLIERKVFDLSKLGTTN